MRSLVAVPELAKLTWREVQAALELTRVALVPVGSTEQHGPHMMLETDTAIAEAFARRLGNELGSSAILCPALPVGQSEHHLAFAGTLTLKAATLMMLVTDVVESLARHGVRRVLLVNGHGGNVDALRLVARAASSERVKVAVVMWAYLAADIINSRAVNKWHSHACDIETSVALAIAPHVVRVDRIEPPGPMPVGNPLSEPGDRIDAPASFDEWTSNGALGDPRLATRELGEEIVNVALERAVSFAQKFIGQGV